MGVQSKVEDPLSLGSLGSLSMSPILGRVLMKHNEARHFGFGDFSLDVGERTLTGLGETALLRPKVFETLHYLLTHSDRIVEKEELLDAVWSDLNVADASLVRTIHELRNLLHDPPDDPRYIRTIPCVGYAFIPPVELIASVGPGKVLQSFSLFANLRRPTLAVMTAATAVLVCMLMFWALRPLWGDDVLGQSAANRRSLVFFPVVTPAGDPQLVGFAREFSEHLVAELDARFDTKLILPKSEVGAAETEVLMSELGDALHLECVVMLDGETVTTVCKLIDPILREVLRARSHEARLDDSSQSRDIALATADEMEGYFPGRR